MIDFAEAFRGVEAVWAIWLGAIAFLCGAAVQAARRLRLRSFARLAADEFGLTYTLSYVMVIPVYLFLILIAYEATWLLVAKVGTMYAAHAGARSAVVWESMKPKSDRDARIEQATTTAMAPFATTSWKHIQLAGGPSANALLAAEEYAQAHRRYSNDPNAPAPRRRPYAQVRASYESLRLRYYCASARTTTKIELADRKPGADLKFIVTYKAPLRIPGPARWLSQRGGPPWEIAIRSYAVLPAETPDTADGTMGIRYRSATRGLLP